MAALEKKYYVNVGAGGTFLPSKKHPEYDTTSADIDSIIENLRLTQQKKIVLYFHGGLVDTPSGMEIAERMYRRAQGSSVFPVTFVWETGLMESLSQNFSTIQGSKFFKKLLVKILKAGGRELGIDLDGDFIGSKGVGSMTDNEIELELEKEVPFEKVSEDIGKKSPLLVAVDDVDPITEDEIKLALETDIYNDPELLALADAEKGHHETELLNKDITSTQPSGERSLISAAALIKAAVKVTVAVIRRHLKKRDHGFYPTVIEEILRELYMDDIGSWVWGTMKKKAADMWKEDDFTSSPEKWHAGSYLLKKLSEYQDEVGELTIDLIGHSAGSIAICHLVDTVEDRFPSLRFRNIIFMAPACRCSLFAKSILKQRQAFKKLYVFTMLDKHEIEDRLFSPLYTRSLLYFISGVLEEHEYDAFILGMERYLTEKAPYDKDEDLKEIRNFFISEKCITYAVTAADAGIGARSSSISHGGFDDDSESTLESVLYLINQ